MNLDHLAQLATEATPTAYAGYFATPDGEIWSTSGWRGHPWRKLTPFPNSHGYPRVTLTLTDGRELNIAVHSIIARTFLGQKPTPAHEVRHLNGDKTDNRVENLAWGTRKENAADRESHGRTAKGTRNGFARLDDDKVREIRQRSSCGESGRSIARTLGVNPATIELVLNGKTWRHVQ